MKIQKALEPFWAAHRAIRVDPEARAPKHTAIDRGMEGQWRVRQVLLDRRRGQRLVLRRDHRPREITRRGRPVLLALERIGT